MDLSRRQFLAGLAALSVPPGQAKKKKSATVVTQTIGATVATGRVDVTLVGPRSATIQPGSIGARATVGAPNVAATNPTGTFPFLISTDFGTGRPSEASQVATWINNRNGSGWTHYITTANPLAWDSTLQTVAAQFPNFPMVLQLTSRNYSDAGMDSVLASLPNAWRPGFTYNYFQEPEDNLAAAADPAAARAAYKATYTSAANRIRAWNAANPTRAVSLPWLEFAQYSLEQLYGLQGTQQSSVRNPALLLPPASDFAGIHWSVFEYQENTSASRLTEKIGSITRWNNENGITKPWGTMGWAYTLEPTTANTDTSVYPSYTQTQKNNQAAWLTSSYNQMRAAGATQLSWYNVKFAGGAPANGDSRIEVIPETLAAYNALDRSA